MKEPYKDRQQSGIVEFTKSQMMKRRDLAIKMNMTERALRQEIHSLNMQGVPIISTGKGFYYSDDVNEIEHAANILRKSAISQLRRAAALLKMKTSKFTEQLMLEFEKEEK